MAAATKFVKMFAFLQPPVQIGIGIGIGIAIVGRFAFSPPMPGRRSRLLCNSIIRAGRTLRFDLTSPPVGAIYEPTQSTVLAQFVTE
ncbi:MAG: hypothetical protein AUK55_09150 [Syntrophobacteraceae bacterium CG2_30_61_12]|nr:MAG: hypothetical protein AUK55_09150 [Syntrophobacteraceae bacterium CG2_30_61_12]